MESPRAVPGRQDGITAIVLAGGSSSRLGVDKRGLRCQGSSFLALAIELGAAVADEVIVSCRATDPPDPVLYAGLAVRLAFDEHGAGPLAGLEAGLRAARNEVAVALPVDMPRLTPAALRKLLDAVTGRPETKAAVFGGEGGPVPLPGVYRRSVLEVLSGLLERRDLRMRSLLDGVSCATVELDRAFLDELLNVNTPEDRLRAES